MANTHRAASMEPEPLCLVGLCLAGESETSTEQVISTLHLPASSRSEKLTACRPVVRNALPESLSQRHFVFLTARGWEINEDLEGVVRVADVVSPEGLIRIRLAYAKPRVGIIVEREPSSSVPVGFIFSDLGITVDEFLQEIERQLPPLYQALSHPATSYAVLDRNGWPISREQQKRLTVIEVLASNAVKVRCVQQQGLVRRTSQYDRQDSGNVPDHPFIYMRSNSDPSSSTSQLPLQSLSLPMDTRRSLSPVQEIIEGAAESFLTQGGPGISEIDYPIPAKGDHYKFEVLLSYVHSEASDCALALKESLQKLGYSVFLDVHCIQGGADWQDALNEAIPNCSLFVPLITLQYGETLWTNREVKLADVLGKIIIPVNFLSHWPPKCLAIQFATTQFIRVPFESDEEDLETMMEEFDEKMASTVASDILNRYQGELKSNKVNAAVNSRVETDADESVVDLSRQDTIDMCDSAGTPLSSPLHLQLGSPVIGLSRKKSMLKSYASTLPQALPDNVRKSIIESRAGKPLVVISCTLKEREFARSIMEALKSKDCEVWCSCDMDTAISEYAQRSVFQNKVDEAGVVVFILSKEFAGSTFCEQQVYYCEQRKRIVPVIYESMQMPNWMAMLIGTSTFVHRKSESCLQTIVERIDCALDQRKSQQELQTALKQKSDLSQLCTRLTSDLQPGKHVYISGSTVFYSSCGKEICEELGKQLAQDLEIILITGGFFGVGETVSKSFFDERMRLNQPHGICHIVAERDEQDKSHQTRQRADRTFEPVPFGDTLFYGDSVRQREMLTPKVIDLCILVEGGPGAAFEAQQFTWNGNRVIPIKVTGGAAGGSFNVPTAILIRPPGVSDSDWSLLGNKSATPSQIASAVVRIVQTLKSSRCPGTAASRSRSNTGGSKLDLMEVKRSQMLSRRETLPESFASKTTPSDSRKRTASLSDKS